MNPSLHFDTVYPHFDATNPLEALLQYDVLDTAPEQHFDDIVHLAAQICGTPISAIGLIYKEREWLKARVGLEISDIPTEHSFCSHAILSDELFIIPDATDDERFADSPFVIAEPHVRFYAGMPLITPQGYAVGALCVVDKVPRQLDLNQQDAMRRLARQVVALLEGRPDVKAANGESRQTRQGVERRRLSLANETTRQDAESVVFSEARYRRLFEAAQDGILIIDAANGHIEDVNPFICQLLNYEPSELLGKPVWEIESFRDIIASQDAFRALQEKEYIRYDDLPVETKDGHRISVEFVSNVVYMCMGKNVVQCNIRDITEHKQVKATHIYTALLEANVRERTRDLEQAQLETLQRLAIASEYRDDETGRHTKRVGQTAGRIAEALKFPLDQVDLILSAAPLHDVGKIGIHDDILLKPGKLTDDEFATMKRHTLIGAEILSNTTSPRLQMAKEIALTHHERWDGKGYPQKLSGEDIPLAGRIVAVADVFDALTHERPYKKAWRVEDAITEIQQQSGTQFDPAVVGVFLNIAHSLYEV